MLLWYYCGEGEQWDSETIMSEIWQGLTSGSIYTNPAVKAQLFLQQQSLKCKSKMYKKNQAEEEQSDLKSESVDIKAFFQ